MKYTVVLLRPDYLSDENGPDPYIALVTADNEYDAVTVAQKEVFKTDKKDGVCPNRKEDYDLVVLFEGHIHPKLFGWQL